MITIKRGLDIPVLGAPEQVIYDGPAITRVATLGEEFVGMRPTMFVKVGDRVIKGQELFEDKKNPGVKFTAPATGVVSEINRGAKRVLQSVVIDITPASARSGHPLGHPGHPRIQAAADQSGAGGRIHRQRPARRDHDPPGGERGSPRRHQGGGPVSAAPQIWLPAGTQGAQAGWHRHRVGLHRRGHQSAGADGGAGAPNRFLILKFCNKITIKAFSA